jgi:L-rhamnonate dehydratase
VGSAMTGRRGLGICAIGALEWRSGTSAASSRANPPGRSWEVLRSRRSPLASLLPDGDTLDAYATSFVQRPSAWAFAP